MPIDTSIAMGYKPIQLADPMNQLAQMMQIKNSQQQMELGDVNLQQHRSALDDKNKLNALYAGSMNPDGTINRDTLMQNAAKQNLGSQIPGIRKGFYEADEAQGKVDKQKVDLIDSKLEQSKEYLNGVRTPEEYIRWHEANHADPILGPALAARGITAEQSRSRIMEVLKQPDGLRQLITESKLGVKKYEELNKPTLTKVDTGNQEITYSIPGLGGTPVAITRDAKGVSPDALLREQRLSRENELNRDTVARSTAPVSVVDPVTGQPVYVTREEALVKRMTPSSAMLSLPPKEIQARESKFPAATAAVQSNLADNVQLEKDLSDLRSHPGLDGITGVVNGRTPSVTEAAREAQAKLDKILARGGFSELAKMRAASPTGGALGSVSDVEGKYLRSAFGALDRTQSTASFQKAIDDAVTELQGSRGRIKDAYDNTYDYRTQNHGTPTPPAAVAATPTTGWGKAVSK